jgi:biotin synthase
LPVVDGDIVMNSMQRTEILDWLTESAPARLEDLFHRADEVRRQHVGDAVHLRGLIELSNHCRRRCIYCGLRAGNATVARYRMTADEVLGCATAAESQGYGTVVLQAGEDPDLDEAWVGDLVGLIKYRTAMAVTLSLGERRLEELAHWREAGADRYLLRFETSNPRLFRSIHPPLAGQPHSRIAILRVLRDLGYEVGSGVMIGIPGQSWDDLADDLELMRTLDLDMIGVGPYIPHLETPMGRHPRRWRLPADRQVPADEPMTLKTIALARLLCPRANIPSTTALATLNPANGRERGLQCGANVIMPNVTPLVYRKAYEIYPNKACIADSAQACNHCVHWRIAAIGRQVGRGRGDSPNRQGRDCSVSPTQKSIPL